MKRERQRFDTKTYKQQQLRIKQMNTLDELPPGIRRAIHEAPVNFDPERIMAKYKTYGESWVINDMTNQLLDFWNEYYLNLRRRT